MFKLEKSLGPKPKKELKVEMDCFLLYLNASLLFTELIEFFRRVIDTMSYSLVNSSHHSIRI